MKKLRLFVCIGWLLVIAHALLGCGKQEADLQPDTQSPAPAAVQETEPGYISTELDMPAWLDSWEGCEIVGERFYLGGHTADGGLAAACYDTGSGQWQRYDLERGELRDPSIESFSASENAAWMLLLESGSYALSYRDLDSGETSCAPLTFWQEGDPYFSCLAALDDERALLSGGESVYVLDSRGQVVEEPELSILGEGWHARIGGELYIQTAQGFSQLDTQTLRLRRTIPGLADRRVWSSSRGRFLSTEGTVLYSFDGDTGEKMEVLDWLDTSLSYSRLCGAYGLETEQGDIYHLTDKLIRVSPGQVPVKKTLTLACLADSSDPLYPYQSLKATCSESLMDAVLRFNNSDPAYKIRIEPLVYESQAERDKLLIQLTTGSGADLLDTSLLPEGAVDRELLVDLLPYIDADDSLSREDFIPGLLESLSRNGGLYEYTDKVTMLTMIARPEQAGEEWTVESALKLMEQNPQLQTPAGRDKLITLFSLAATAEFMDWGEMRCDFESPAFLQWLAFLKALDSRSGADGEAPWLFSIDYDFAMGAGIASRMKLDGDYRPVGFPGAEGTGSYFTRLGIAKTQGGVGRYDYDESMFTVGGSTSLGILASGEDRDGAWRFVRAFILGEEEPELSRGIPVLKESFERAVQAELDKKQEDVGYAPFNESDAQALRELVLGTEKMTCSDKNILDAMRTVLSGYLDGLNSAEGAARQLQSRLSLYMAERA